MKVYIDILGKSLFFNLGKELEELLSAPQDFRPYIEYGKPTAEDEFIFSGYEFYSAYASENFVEEETAVDLFKVYYAMYGVPYTVVNRK